MKYPKLISLIFIITMTWSCSEDEMTNNGESDTAESLIGTWYSPGHGKIFVDGTDEFSPWTYNCAFEGTEKFDSDGTFELIGFDGPDDECFETERVTGVWEKINDSKYSFTVLNINGNSDVKEPVVREIIFIDSNILKRLESSEEENVEHVYTQFERIE